MGVYRGNLAVWSPSTFQVWQVDPDPAVMALLDAMEGIGSMHQQAVQPVSDDLFFLAALGVRTVSIAEGANNLAAGDVGVPIDVLVQAEANQPDVEPVASYYPSGGQFWLAFRPLTLAAGLLAGQFLMTSPPYPAYGEDGFSTGGNPAWGRTLYVIEEAISTGGQPSNSLLHGGLVEHTNPDEAIETGGQPEDSSLYGNLITTTAADEAIETGGRPEDSSLFGDLLVYTHPDEAIETAGNPEDSTLT